MLAKVLSYVQILATPSSERKNKLVGGSLHRRKAGSPSGREVILFCL